MRIDRTALHDLADQLVIEYRGAVPPGQVLALVFRTARRLAGLPTLTPEAHAHLCETTVRRALTDRIGAGVTAARVA